MYISFTFTEVKVYIFTQNSFFNLKKLRDYFKYSSQLQKRIKKRQTEKDNVILHATNTTYLRSGVIPGKKTELFPFLRRTIGGFGLDSSATQKFKYTSPRFDLKTTRRKLIEIK